MPGPLETKAMVTLPGWVEQLQQTDKVTSTSSAFERVPLLFRAVRLRCNSLVRVPIHVYRGPVECDWPFDQPLKTLVWKTEASLLLAGAAYWLRLRNDYGFLKGAQWLNPFSVRVTYAGGERRFEQRMGSDRYPRDREFWTDQDLLFWQEFNPTDDLGPGISPAGVALGDAQLLSSLARFAAVFFESGAMPVTIVGLPPGTGDSDRDRVESFFKRLMTGVRNAWRVLGVRGEIKPTILTPPLDHLAIPELRHQAIDAVAWAFDIPRTMFMEDVANRATAESYFQTYVTQTIVPRAQLFEEQLNTFLKGTGYSVRFRPEEMAEIQAQQSERARAFAAYVHGGMTPPLAAAVLGIDIPREFEEAWKDGRSSALARVRKETP